MTVAGQNKVIYRNSYLVAYLFPTLVMLISAMQRCET